MFQKDYRLLDKRILSKDRLVFTNSVLDSLPTYTMSLFPIHTSLAKKLDKICRISNENRNKKVFYHAYWETVQKDENWEALE